MMRKILIWTGAIILSTTALTGCGQHSPTSSEPPSSHTSLTKNRETSPTPSAQTLHAIAYTSAQWHQIVTQAREGGFAMIYVPLRAMTGTRFQSAYHATTMVSKIPVFSLAYTNLLIQQAARAHSFGTGGDILQNGTISLHILGDPHTIVGKWSVVGNMGGNSSGIEFTLAGQYYSVVSTTLTVHQIAQVIASFRRILVP